MKKPLTFVLGMTLAAHPAFAQTKPEDGAAVLPGIVVRDEDARKAGAYNPKTLSLGKIPTPLIDTPQSATIINKEVLQDQAVTTLREALDNVTGISMAAGEGGAQGDNLTIRGFSARSDLFLDGMRDFGNYYRDPFNIDEIEVLKGPSSFTFGRGSTGGVLNQESKTPKLEKFTNATLMGGSAELRRATIDTNTPLGESSAFRLNVMGNENGVVDRDVAEYRRFGLAPSLAFGLNKSTQVKLLYFHQSENNISDYGIPILSSRPAPVDRSNYYGFKDTNFARTDADIATVIAEHASSDNTSWRNQTRYAVYKRVMQTTAPRIASGVTPATPLEDVNVERSQVAVDSTESLLSNDLNVTTSFGPQKFRHTLVAGVEASLEESSPTRKSFTGVPSTPLLDPSPNDAFTGTGSISARGRTTLTTIAGYAVDTLKLGRLWEVLAGLRWDYVGANYRNQLTSTTLNRFDNLPSYRAGLVYKPAENASVYFGYGTSFNPSAEQISLSAANVDLDPEKNESFELGTKWDLANGDLSLTGALFRTTKKNARTPDPDDPNLNILAGEQRVDGLEVGATGRLSKRVKLFAGYTYLDAKLMRSSKAEEIGARLANTPKNTLSIWGTFEPAERWEFGAGVVGVGERTLSTTPDTATGQIRTVDGYLRWDAMAKYRLQKELALQLNVANVLNTEYMDSLYPAHVVPGAGRTFQLSALFNF